MKVRCEAVVENPVQRENLCECINIIGGVPKISRDTISVEIEGEKVDKMIELFEHYVRHTITTIA